MIPTFLMDTIKERLAHCGIEDFEIYVDTVYHSSSARLVLSKVLSPYDLSAGCEESIKQLGAKILESPLVKQKIQALEEELAKAKVVTEQLDRIEAAIGSPRPQ